MSDRKTQQQQTITAVAALAGTAALAGLSYWAYTQYKKTTTTTSAGTAAAAAGADGKQSAPQQQKKEKGQISTVDPDGWVAPYVHKDMFAENRKRLVAAMRKALGGNSASSGHCVVLQGGTTLNKYDTDHEYLFRQESHFFYCFGVPEPDCYGALDLARGTSILFVPKLGESYSVWCGAIKPPSFYAEKYGVDEVRFVDDLATVLFAERGLTAGVHTLAGATNSDSGLTIADVKWPGGGAAALSEHKVRLCSDGVLYRELCECRVIKTERELALMRHINAVSSDAHVHVMRQLCASKQPAITSEHELEALFQYYAYREYGCRNMSYVCICCSGENGAVLHYGHAGAPNDKKLQRGDMLLLDMGAEYQSYASDITCSYPANGKFTLQQKQIFEAVSAAQRAVIAAMRPGVEWASMHYLAERVLLEHLLAIGLVVRPPGHELTSLEVMRDEYELAAIFMPHGLGHLLGLDTHDVGGYLAGNPKCLPRPTRSGACKLRMNRILEPGMVLTVEPGLYFIEPLLRKALANPKQAPWLNAHKLWNEFGGFGGVRLEDDVIVTAGGCENMTHCPRTVADVESVMSGGAWPSAVKKQPPTTPTTAAASTATAAAPATKN